MGEFLQNPVVQIAELPIESRIPLRESTRVRCGRGGGEERRRGREKERRSAYKC